MGELEHDTSGDEPAPPPIVYHYCSAAALMGILQHKCIWLTSIHCLNDYMEHLWLRRIAAEEAKKIPSISEDYATKLSEALGDERPAPIYCASFSELGDSLRQWIPYADDGRGYAIGFDFRSMKSILGPHQVIFDKVVYDESEQRKLVRDEIAGVGGDRADITGHPIGSQLGVFFSKLNVWMEAARCKHPSFADEAEWRIVYRASLNDDGAPRLISAKQPFSELRFRERDGTIIPYVEMSLETDSKRPVIREIVFGPKNQIKANALGVLTLLRDKGHTNVDGIEFRQSEATYR